MGFYSRSAVNAGLPEQEQSDSLNVARPYESSNMSFSIVDTSSTGTPEVDTIMPTSTTVPNTDYLLKATKETDKPATKEKHSPFSADWTTQRIREDDLPKAVGVLMAWMPNCRSCEATESTVLAICSLDQKCTRRSKKLGQPEAFHTRNKGAQSETAGQY